MISPALSVARERIAAELVAQTGKLDLSRLRLTELPAELETLTHLQSLECSSTWVSDLTPLRGLSQLRSLKINQCDWLRDLEPLRSLVNLLSLDFFSSAISDLTPLRGLKSLQSLEIGSTSVSDLSPLSDLTNLQTLNCSGTYVSDLTPLRSLIHLQSLNCGYTKVKDLTPVRNLPSLRQLDCDGTQVSDLAPLQDLPNLQSFRFSNDGVIDLSPLRYIPSLRSLDLNSARFTSLPALQDLTNLQNLDCGNTELNDLSPLCGLTNLQSLKCYRTQVDNLEALRNLTSLKSLECFNTHISDLSPLQNLVNLELLSCRDTNVTDLSPLKNLINLQELDCSHTAVGDLSPLQDLISLKNLFFSITKVSDLTSLDFLMNLRKLVFIGTDVSDLLPLRDHLNLQHLDFAGSPVHNLEPLKELTKLKRLNINNTPVSDLSPLQCLRNLESLSLEDTRARDLTPLADLQALYYLNCENNNVIEFPRKLLLSPELQQLKLGGTRIQGVPDEIWSNRSFNDSKERLANLRAHIRDLEEAAIPVNCMKILVLGNGGVGKTQLCRHLAGESFDTSVPSTHGISVRTISAATPEEASLTLWDFGGQDIYHSAHTLFMRTAAVFLVLWTPEQDELVGSDEDDPLRRRHPLSYWLEYVRSLGPCDSPVVVVQSQCDRPDQAVLLPPVDPDLLASFSCLRCCSFSARSKRGTATLQEALRDATDFLVQRDGISSIGRGRHLVWQQLETWRQADQELPTQQRKHRTLSQQEFAKLCGDIGGVSCPKSLLLYLHNKGVVFHRRELFLDHIILDQSWALDAVYAVFDRETTYRLIKADDGRFSPSLLAATVWRGYEPDAQRLFISLMLSCAIICPQRPEDASTGLEARYLAPDLLPSRSSPQVSMHLQGRWDGREPCLMITYRYPFLHDGLVRALLCDVGNHAGEAGVYWRYGAWVYDAQEGCIALLEQQTLDDHEGEISIRFQGTTSSALAQWFSQRLAERNRQFGYTHLRPTISGTLASPDLAMEHQDLIFNEQDEAVGEEGEADRGASKSFLPKLSAVPAETFHKSGREVFISYARGDQTPEGKERQRIVDEIIQALANHPQQINVRIDRDELRPGQLISAFMDRLAAADRVIVVISAKYLRSEYCMYELFKIYQNCRKQAEDFQRRIIPIVLPDARHSGRLAARLKLAAEWNQQLNELKPLFLDNPAVFGVSGYQEYLLIDEFARNSSDMLKYLHDQLQPRDYDRQIEEGFTELCEQILAE